MNQDLQKQIVNARPAALSGAGKWRFHPKPQTKPVSVKEAIADVPDSPRMLNSDRTIAIWHKIKPGQDGSFTEQGKRKSFSLKKLDPSRPCNTLTKGWTAGSGLMHWAEPRFLSTPELAVIGSFGSQFRFAGEPSDHVERIGNSVPPNLMKAIAENLRISPFLKDVDRPTVISTFAGCGGSSLGYKLAGFKELLAVEWDANAVETFKLNFPEVPVFHGDIASLSVEKCRNLAGLRDSEELDCFDGSPPCQGFSTAGRRKFDDPRNSLFKEYARLLEGLQPKCFVMENVTGMIKGYMKQSYLQIVETLRSAGYVVQGQVLNAMYYNVPQSRERVIIIGVRSDLVHLIS